MKVGTKVSKKSGKKMKILMLNYEFPPLGGGASPVSYELGKGYAKLGHEVSVVTMGYKDLPEYEEKDGMKIYRVKCLRSKKEICHPWEQLSYLYSAKKFLNKHLKENKYDICHCHFIIPTGILAKWVKNKFGIPYIVTAHGSDVPGYNTDRFQLLHKFTGPTLRRICLEAKIIVSPSKYLANLILENISKDCNVKIIPNGVFIDKFIPKKKKKIILSTGRLLPRKGFQYLIQAVNEKDCGYKLHICGDGPIMEELRSLAKKSKTNVVLHGWMDNNSKEYRDLLESASIYSLVSKKENASIALLEAMSAGCAIITSDVSGCPETVGDAGFVVKPEEVGELRKVIYDLTSDKKMVNKFGKLARKRLEKQYDWNKIIDKYLKEIV
jgi:glycosyltransferase involved in cell wall biosynthesis